MSVSVGLSHREDADEGDEDEEAIEVGEDVLLDEGDGGEEASEEAAEDGAEEDAEDDDTAGEHSTGLHARHLRGGQLCLVDIQNLGYNMVSVEG